MSEVYTEQSRDGGHAESSHEVLNHRVAIVTHTGEDGRTYTKVWISESPSTFGGSKLVANIDMETGQITQTREGA